MPGMPGAAGMKGRDGFPGSSGAPGAPGRFPFSNNSKAQHRQMMCVIYLGDRGFAGMPGLFRSVNSSHISLFIST
jgi:hypothetical protein